MRAVEAIVIFQEILDILSQAVFQGNLTKVLEHIALPYHMRTINGWFPLNTVEDIEEVLRSRHLSMKVQGATDYMRIAKSAEFTEDGAIEGIYTTHVLRNGTQLIPSYQSRMTMKKFDGTWMATKSKHSINNHKWPVSMPKVDTGDLSQVDLSSEVDDIAMSNYQEYLDLITDININGTLKDWEQVCEFPHRVQINQMDTIIDTMKDMEPFFSMVKGLVTDNPLATLKRTADYAGFLDSHTLRGYHTATLASVDREVFPPVRSRITIRFSKRKWRMIEVVNSIANDEYPYTQPIVSDHMVTEFHYPKKDTQ